MEALLGAHFQVGQKQLYGASGPEVWASKVVIGGARQAAVECTYHQAATHGEHTAELSPKPGLGPKQEERRNWILTETKWSHQPWERNTRKWAAQSRRFRYLSAAGISTPAYIHSGDGLVL